MKKDFSNVIMLIVAVASVYLQIIPPKTAEGQIRSLILFIVIIIYVGIIYFISEYAQKIKGYLGQIKENKEEINKIKETMNSEKRFTEMEKKMAVIESHLNKRGNFDLNPKIILMVILLVLFYLYLRSLGIVP